jgi:AcrR family transcriptional regulator
VRHTDRHTALREQLIDAAECTIAEKGLTALKARDLAQEVGCAVGTIYNVFEHLDELVLCVGLRTLAMLEAALAVPSPSRHGSADEAVADMVRLAWPTSILPPSTCSAGGRSSSTA